MRFMTAQSPVVGLVGWGGRIRTSPKKTGNPLKYGAIYTPHLDAVYNCVIQIARLKTSVVSRIEIVANVHSLIRRRRQRMSDLVRIAGSNRTARHVRKVPDSEVDHTGTVG
jgi:hypothetical protein